MSRHLRSEQGAQIVELALLATVLMLLVTAALPIVQLGLSQSRLARAADDGLRFATRAAPNPCHAGTSGCEFTDTTSCASPLRRRASSSEVHTYVQQALGAPAGLTVTLSREPCGANSGDAVGITVSRPHDLGPLAQTANRLATAISGHALFNSTTVTVARTATGYQE